MNDQGNRVPNNLQSLPKPYLSTEEVQGEMARLGFAFESRFVEGKRHIVLIPGQEARFQALMNIVAGAIAEWADVKDDFGDHTEDGELTPEKINNELQEWAEEYLVG